MSNENGGNPLLKVSTEKSIENNTPGTSNQSHIINEPATPHIEKHRRGKKYEYPTVRIEPDRDLSEQIDRIAASLGVSRPQAMAFAVRFTILKWEEYVENARQGFIDRYDGLRGARQ